VTSDPDTKCFRGVVPPPIREISGVSGGVVLPQGHDIDLATTGALAQLEAQKPTETGMLGVPGGKVSVKVLEQWTDLLCRQMKGQHLGNGCHALS